MDEPVWIFIVLLLIGGLYFSFHGAWIIGGAILLVGGGCVLIMTHEPENEIDKTPSEVKDDR